MGCVADKPVPENRSLPIYKSSPSNPSPAAPPKEARVHYKLTEAIKKRDLILLRRAILHSQIKPHEVLGPSEQAKTVLHKLAEHNFSEGMALFIEELTLQKNTQISQILNMKDIDGNTPLLLCCLSDAVETLEVLSRCEHVDVEVKNFAKKTALEIAVEMESPCANILTCLSNGTLPATKATLKSCGEGSQQIKSLEEAIKPQQEKEEEGVLEGQNTRTSLDCRSPISSSKEIKESQGLRGTLELSSNSVRFCQIVADLKSRNTNFVDSEFPHEIYYLEDEEAEGSLVKKFPRLTWSRPNQLFNGDKYTVFENFDLNGTAKIPLTGCEVYSAFAAMAEFPQRLSRVFNTKEVNKHGMYSVNFTIAGVPLEIFLDDFFPSTDGSQLLFSKPTSSELWFLLLEKAFAKLYGGYTELETVKVLEALEILTGMPVAQRALKDTEEDKLWAKLLDYDKKNYIVCAGETRGCQNGLKNRIFTLVSIAEVNDYKLLKMRNPYGDFAWEGDFSHKSALWTKEMKEQVGYCPTDTTCFYMELKDFISQFEYLTVCHYHDDWIYTRFSANSQHNHPVYFELDVDKELETYISVHQKSPRFVDEGHAYNVSPVEIILAKETDGNSLESIAFGEHEAFLGKSSIYVHESHKVKLQPGRYLIYVKVKWVDNNPHEFFLNLFSSSPAKIAEFKPPGDYNFLEKVYLSSGWASREKFALLNDCQFASGWSGSHLWMFVHNKSTKTFILEISFEKMISLKLGKRFRSSPNVIKFVVPPNQKAAAYAKRTSPAAVAVGWEFSQRFE